MTAIHYYPPGIVSNGGPCWCMTQQLAAHVLSREVDGTLHCRSWCERLNPVPAPAAPGVASPGASPETG